MSILLAGLLIFLTAHSMRMIAPAWRAQQIARHGENAWKAAIALASLAGLVLIVTGYADTRQAAELWTPPVPARHIAALLTLPAFVLVVAAYVPKNAIRAALGHPMLAGVKLWALAHLIANGRPGDLLLFGALLAWSVADFIASRRRDRNEGRTMPPGSSAGTVATLAIGTLAWGLFAIIGHAWLIGVAPFH